MNWNILIYAGMAAFGTGMMTAVVIFIEMKIPTVIRQLRSSSAGKRSFAGKRRYVGRDSSMRQEKPSIRGSLTETDSVGESKEKQPSVGRETDEIGFIVTRRIVLSHMERRKTG